MIIYQKRKKKRSSGITGVSERLVWAIISSIIQSKSKGRETQTPYHLWLRLSVYAVKKMCWTDHTKTVRRPCISADGEASLFARTKGKHCAQHVFLMKASEQRRTAVPYRRTSETKEVRVTEPWREGRKSKRGMLQKLMISLQIPSYPLLHDWGELWMRKKENQIWKLFSYN